MIKTVLFSWFFSMNCLCGILAQTENGKEENDLPDNCWRWEKMKPDDLTEALEKVPVAYLVVSPLEWHADAMAFGTDPIIGTAIAEKAWRETGGVLIPTIYVGTETEYHDFTETGYTPFWGMEWNTREHNPGSLYISPITLELLMREMLSFIEEEGFKFCVVVTGHGAIEHLRVLNEIEQLSEGRPMKILFRNNLVKMERPEEMFFYGSGGHADFAEASILGAVDSTLVDKSKFGKSERDHKVKIMEENVGKIDYAKGKKSIDFRANRIVETVKAELGAIK
jgi:creatinine amidohydrolase/Fe(II)-dependent formamide hydrolase-like protein